MKASHKTTAVFNYTSQFQASRNHRGLSRTFNLYCILIKMSIKSTFFPSTKSSCWHHCCAWKTKEGQINVVLENFCLQAQAWCCFAFLSFKNRPHQCHVTGNSWGLLSSRADGSQEISLITNQICMPTANRSLGMFQESVRTFGHVLCDDIDGFLRHYCIKRHQFVVSELLHNLSLLEEGLWRHGSRFQRLYGHLGGAIPRACREKERERKAHRPQG